MLDTSLINPSEEAIPAKFDLMVSYNQSERQRSVRNPLHRKCDESRGKRLNDRVEDENFSLEFGVAANQLVIKFQEALRPDEQKRVADEVERRVAERTRELAEANAELQLQAGLLQHLPVSAWTLKPDGTPDFVNRVWLEFSGQTLDFVRSHPEAWMNAVHPEDRASASLAFWEGVRSGRGFAVETRSLRAQDGTYRWHLNQAVPLRDANGRVLKFVGTTTDIDDQKRAEEELQRKEAFLADGQRLSLTGSFSWRMDTDKFVFSEEACRIFEFQPDAPVTLEQISSRVHPDDIALLSERISAPRTTGEDHDYEIRLRMLDGRVKYVHAVSRATRDQDGHLEYIGAIQDVTERRLAEEALNELRSELAHMARVTSLGALTASIAHEVNQPLAGIVTNASTCLRTLSADPPNIDGAREAAQRAIRDGNRASEVIARLRALFSKKESTTESVDLNEATREVIALCSDDLQRNRVILRQEFANDLRTVMGDRVQLQQVILNLLRNASDAMSGVIDRPRELVITTGKDEGDRVRLTVQDTGVGIPPQDMDRLFESFYTTKSDGMGMGLSVSRSIIESHRGRLWATPNDGPGATFAFSIPCEPEGFADQQILMKTRNARRRYQIPNIAKPERIGSNFHRELIRHREEIPIAFVTDHFAGTLRPHMLI
jgi:PAS domain S-box-containing protein